MSNFWEYLKSWAQEPFNPKGDLWAWFLFVGLLIVLALIWAHVISYVKPVARAVAETV